MHIIKFVLLKAFFLFAALFFLLFSIAIYQQIASTLAVEWESTNATIIKSEFSVVDRRRGTSYCPKLLYKYVVNNKEYVGNDTHHKKSNCFYTESHVTNFIEMYPVNRNFTLYYSSVSPQDSAIIVGEHWSSYLIFISLVVGTGAFSYMLFRVG